MDGIIDSFHSSQVAEAAKEVAYMGQMFSAFNGLKGGLTREGDLWCASSGDWPEHNITGYGKSPCEAMNKWFSEYFKPIESKNMK